MRAYFGRLRIVQPLRAGPTAHSFGIQRFPALDFIGPSEWKRKHRSFTGRSTTSERLGRTSWLQSGRLTVGQYAYAKTLRTPSTTLTTASATAALNCCCSCYHAGMATAAVAVAKLSYLLQQFVQLQESGYWVSDYTSDSNGILPFRASSSAPWFQHLRWHWRAAVVVVVAAAQQKEAEHLNHESG